MNRLVLLLISLISTSSCRYMTSVGVDQMTVLSPGDDKESYFYLKADRYSQKGKVYLLVQDQGSGFEYDEIEICYTDEDPSSSNSVKNCDFKEISYYSKDKGDVDAKNYYYKFNNVNKKDNIFRENIIVRFERKSKTNSGILTVKTSTVDIYKEKKGKDSRNSSPAFQIILICVGLLILLAAIITGIASVYSWYKKKKFFTPQLKEEQQPNLEAEFPENSPLGL